MICRFVNASTADGYNPYRITRDGIDWEVVDPHDPWSYIGYWGDHQIIYLLKLLEILDRHDPATLHGFLTREIFAYANVPYRIKPYEALLANPKDTVVFDPQLEALVQQRVRDTGADGKLVWDQQRRRAPGESDREAPGPAARQAVELHPRSRHLAEHAAARMERREQCPRG